MAISEDSLAIIAASLTAAHCSLTGPLANQGEDGGTQVRKTVLEVYQSYARSLGLGVAVGTTKKTVDKAAAN